MKRKVQINPKAQTIYVPKDIIEDGFSGEADAYADAFTLTVVKPGISLERAIQSLRVVLQDLQLRLGIVEEVEDAKVNH